MPEAKNILTAPGPGGSTLVEAQQGGVMVTPRSTDLKRLNFFDGKFLRADDFKVEQRYVEQLVGLSNSAGAAGVVHGLDVVLGPGGALRLGAGLAIDPEGRVLYLPATVDGIDVRQLIAASRPGGGASETTGGGPAGAAFAPCVVVERADGAVDPIVDAQVYVVSICHAEALCGEENVFGRLCEAACATATDRRYRIDGLVLRATPIALGALLPAARSVVLGPEHLRSRVASAYFRGERPQGWSSLIDEGRLLDGGWCQGARPDGGCAVPLALLVRRDLVFFVDAWAARRERMETHPRRYWAWRMNMRPWATFLAQVFQFQCQLQEVLRRPSDGTPPEPPCTDYRRVLTDAQVFIRALEAQPDLPGGPQELDRLRKAVDDILGKAAPPPSGRRVLIEAGIVELPAAGYLPVQPGSADTVNAQVQRLLGEGVDLRFCVVRPDYVPHALEEAQHMDRISLLEGLDDPARKPEVDVLVPDGQIVPATTPGGAGAAFRGSFLLGFEGDDDPTPDPRSGRQGQPFLDLRGVGRAQAGPGQAVAFHYAGAGNPILVNSIKRITTAGAKPPTAPGRARQPARKAAAAARAPAPAGAFEDLRRRVDNAARLAREISFRRAAGLDAGGATRAAAASAADASMGGIWLTIAMDRPLGSLDPLASMRVSGRLLVTDLEGESKFHGIELDGSVTIQSRVPVAGGTLATGTLQGVLSTDDPGDDASAPRRVIQSHPVSMKLEHLVRAGSGRDRGREELRLIELLPNRRIAEFHALHDWDVGLVPQRQVTFSAVRRDKAAAAEDTDTYFGIDLDADGNVLDARSPLRQLASGAIDVLGAMLPTEPTFEEEARRALFAPLAPASTSNALALHAVHDWVLFHRRRSKQCSVIVTPEALPPRRYRVRELTVRNMEDAKSMFDAARDPQRQAELVARLRDEPAFGLIVEYEGEGPRLLSDRRAIALDWAGFRPGASLAFAVIASEGQGFELERQRLAELVSAIPAELTDTGTLAGTRPLPTVPVALLDPGTDGTILFITVEVSLSVHALVPAALGDLRPLLADGNADSIRRFLQEQKTALAYLTQVNFDATANARPAESANVKDEWDALEIGTGHQPPRAVASALLWAPQNDAAAARIAAEWDTIRARSFPQGAIQTETVRGRVPPAAILVDAGHQGCEGGVFLVPAQTQPDTRLVRLVVGDSTGPTIIAIRQTRAPVYLEIKFTGTTADVAVKGDITLIQQLSQGGHPRLEYFTQPTSTEEAKRRLEAIVNLAIGLKILAAGGRPSFAESAVAANINLDQLRQPVEGRVVPDIVVVHSELQIA